MYLRLIDKILNHYDNEQSTSTYLILAADSDHQGWKFHKKNHSTACSFAKIMIEGFFPHPLSLANQGQLKWHTTVIQSLQNDLNTVSNKVRV